MKNYVILYRIESIQTPSDAPFGFQAWAEDTEHAEEQCLDAYPDCGVVWVYQCEHGTGTADAFNNYYTEGLAL